MASWNRCWETYFVIGAKQPDNFAQCCGETLAHLREETHAVTVQGVQSGELRLKVRGNAKGEIVGIHREHKSLSALKQLYWCQRVTATSISERL